MEALAKGVTGCLAESAPQTVETQDHFLNATQVVFAPETFNPFLRAAKRSGPLSAVQIFRSDFIYGSNIYYYIRGHLLYIAPLRICDCCVTQTGSGVLWKTLTLCFLLLVPPLAGLPYFALVTMPRISAAVACFTFKSHAILCASVAFLPTLELPHAASASCFCFSIYSLRFIGFSC